MPDAFALPDELAREFKANEFNPCVGQVLLSETSRVRVWSIRLAPGERIGFHRHVLDYFWTALTPGTARSHVDGGAPVTVSYKAGDTQHYVYPQGAFKIHDLENAGDSELAFVTVEFLQSANLPLPLPADVRRSEAVATAA